MALSFQLFGISNFSLRLPSAIFGSLCLVMVFFLGKKLYSRPVGLISAFVLGTFVTFFTFSQRAMTDLPFVFFMLTSLYFMLVSVERKNSYRFMALSGLLFGCAFLTKQLAAGQIGRAHV
jgi:4-amino-4-deoxy-L-arabinose transferase-like glycosyltransferase